MCREYSFAPWKRLYKRLIGYFSLSSIGKLHETEPQRHYTYALLDPVDEPRAEFRFLFRQIPGQNIQDPATVKPQNGRRGDGKRSLRRGNQLLPIPQIALYPCTPLWPTQALSTSESSVELRDITHQIDTNDGVRHAHKALTDVIESEEDGAALRELAAKTAGEAGYSWVANAMANLS